MDHQYANMKGGGTQFCLDLLLLLVGYLAIISVFILLQRCHLQASDLNDGVGGLPGHTLMAEQGVEKWAKHTAVEKLQ